MTASSILLSLRPSSGKFSAEQEQQRVAVGPGNAHFISIHQVPSVIIINLKIRHGVIVDNVDAYVYAKFGDDRL